MGSAVREMLKIATMMHKAMKTAEKEEDDMGNSLLDFNLNSKLSDLKAAAEILRGRRVPAHVRAVCVPGSKTVRRDAEAPDDSDNT